jgi:hypothetical protein
VKELQLPRKARRGDRGWMAVPFPGGPVKTSIGHLVRDWWERMQKDAKLRAERGRGWHSLRGNLRRG